MGYKTAIANAYYEGNKASNKANADKLYNYTLLDKDFRPISNGVCKEVSNIYDPCYDYNITSFTDVETEEKYSVCQFYVRLKEIEK